MPLTPKSTTGTGLQADGLYAERQLALLAEQLGLDLEQLTQDQLEALEQWLLGGMELPPVVAELLPTGEGLPPESPFAVVLAQSNEGVSRAQQMPGGPMFTELAEPDSLPGKTPLAQSVLSALQLARAESPLPETLISSPALTVSAPSGAAAPFPKVLADNLLSMTVPQPVTSEGWGKAVGERLLWMVKGDQQFAELKITPPNLGPMEVKLTLNNDQASVAFLSNHAAVRDALEAAIPRLREMMSQESLTLVNVDVGSQQQAESGHSDRSGGRHAGATSGEQEAGEFSAEEQSSGTAAGAGLVDLFV